jgi:phosphoribosylformimino-5-aminoimidazole carboxamide ribotide isomerase
VTFDIFPAIDLLGGRSVRLKKGLRSSAEVVHANPLAQLAAYADAGARWVHVVDLAAAFGDLPESSDLKLNKATLCSLVEHSKIKVQVGGGVRSEAQARALFDLGVERVVVGTWAIKDPSAVCHLAKAHPGRVVVGLDSVGGFVSVQGWTEKSQFTPAEFGKRLFEGGVTLGLFTEVERDGLLTGIDWKLAETLARESGLNILASGGVKDIEDIKHLSKCTGVVGVVVGKALAAGSLNLTEALGFQRK